MPRRPRCHAIEAAPGTSGRAAGPALNLLSYTYSGNLPIERNIADFSACPYDAYRNGDYPPFAYQAQAIPSGLIAVAGASWLYLVYRDVRARKTEARPLSKPLVTTTTSVSLSDIVFSSYRFLR